jgi:8-amino-7-oxononanoate synthase
MPHSFDWLDDELQQLHETQLFRRRRAVRALPDGWCEVDGRRLRNFASNDYLNLAHDERLIAAARDALSNSGVGSRASALVIGRTDWHARLEERLAKFERQPSAILFPTGYAANVGTVAALVERGDIVFSDQMNHASLIDGCRLSRAEVRIYPHDDSTALERELKRSDGFRRRLIVTDSYFSMDGDVASLPELCDLAERYDAALLVDEAHATGVFGSEGRGVAEWLGVESRVNLRVGTLSKGVGALGGFVAGSAKLIDWLWNRARTQMFSTALPAAVCAAACAAIDIIETESWRRMHLRALNRQLNDGLAELGLNAGEPVVGPIVPIVLHHPGAALAAAEELEERGVLVAAIRPPTVPEATSRLRIALTCAHDATDMTRLLAALSDVLAATTR